MAVLVTRPDERGKTLVDQLNQAGVVALHLPLLSIEAGTELAQLPTKLNQLKSGDYVFLVSKSAVDFDRTFFMCFEKGGEKGYASFNGIRKEKYHAGYDK